MNDPKCGADDGKAHGSDAAAGPTSDDGGALGFEEVLAEHLLGAEAGEAPDREAFIRRHPQWAAELRAIFADESQVQRLAGLNPSPDPTAAFEQAGATVGRYKLLERIGEGGFGVVFMAEQTHPVRRKVAI